MRVEELPDGVDTLGAQLSKVVEELLVDELEALAIALVFRFFMRVEGLLEAVEYGD
jgi:hypothetical protein